MIAAGAAAALAPLWLSLALLALLALVTVAAAVVGRPIADKFKLPSDANTSAFAQVIFALVAVGVFMVTFNAIRPIPGATASDFMFAAAFVVIGLAFIDADWRVRKIAPTWLLAAAVLLLSAALLVEIFPARPSQAALLFPGGLFSGEVADRAQPTLSTNGGAAVRFAGALVLLPVLIAAAANSPRKIRFLAEAWIAGAALGGLLGVLEYLGVLNIELIGFTGASAHGRAASLATHVFQFGLVSAMALPIAAARLGGTQGRARIYYSAVVASLVAGIVVSGSRAALLGGSLGLVLVAALHREGRRGLARAAAISALLAILVGIAVAPSRLPAIERLIGSDSGAAISTEHRVAGYHAVWHEILERPVVGWGFEYVRSSHSIYLQLLHAGGIIALAGFLLFAIGSVTTGFRLGSNEALPDSMQGLARASVASLTVWFVLEGIVASSVFDRYLYVPAGIIVAIWALERDRKTTPKL